MSWQFTPYAIAFIVAASISIVLAFVVWRRRAVPGGAFLALLMVALAEWMFTAALEAAAVEIPAKILCSKIEYLGVVSSPTLFLLFALDYSRQSRWLTRRNVALLWIVPILTVVVAVTNDWHGWLWSSFTPTGNNHLIYSHGAWFWFSLAYFYLEVFAGTVSLVWAVIRFPHLYRRQAGAVLIGAAMPWVGNAIYVLDVNPIPGLDLTPLAFVFAGLMLAWGILRYHLLDLVPVARGLLIERMHDGVLVLDAQNRVVDMNPAAQWFTGIVGESAIGQRAEMMLAAWPGTSAGAVQELLTRGSDAPEAQAEIVLDGDEGESRVLDLRVTPLHDRRRRFVGRLIVWRDITERKRAEEKIHRRNRTLNLLNRVGQELSATLDLQQVFGRLLQTVTEIIDAEGAAIWLEDKKQQGWLVRQAVFFPGLKRPPAPLRLQPGQGIVGWVAQKGESTIVPDAPNDPRFCPDLEEQDGFHTTALLVVPLRFRDATIGVLEVMNKLHAGFDEDDRSLVETLGAPAAIAIENAWLFEEVQQLSITDDLTAVYNRRYFERQLNREFQRARRYARPLALLMLDLDHFKEINDRYGHLVGDALLSTFAALLRVNVRETDIVTRYGGEEFAVILPETDLANAVSVIEKTRQVVADHPFTYKEHVLHITFSAGAATLPDLAPTDAEDLVRQADQALSQAKQRGRNQVCAA